MFRCCDDYSQLTINNFRLTIYLNLTSKTNLEKLPKNIIVICPNGLYVGALQTDQ